MGEPFPPEGLLLEQARTLILEQLQPLAAYELLPLAACLGRVCAEAVFAVEAIPGFRAAIMDGYAIAADHPPQIGSHWRLVGSSVAGAPYAAALAHGEAVRILTGAVVPEGSAWVLPQELVGSLQISQEECVELLKPCGTNPWIRNSDEEAYQGQELLGAGKRIGVAELGRFASCGVNSLKVAKSVRLGLLISGDELISPGISRAAGQIWESNSVLLTGILKKLGYQVTKQIVVADEPVLLRQAMLDLANNCDVVVSTGGVSSGDTDWIRSLVAELGEVRFWKLFLKPGRPFAWGEVAGTPFFGLPGNPVAAVITALQLLWPALQRLEGGEIQSFPRFKVQLEDQLQRTAGRPELMRATLVVAANGAPVARLAGSQASSRIGSLEAADLLLEIPAEQTHFQAGSELWAQLLRLPIF